MIRIKSTVILFPTSQTVCMGYAEIISVLETTTEVIFHWLPSFLETNAHYHPSDATSEPSNQPPKDGLEEE